MLVPVPEVMVTFWSSRHVFWLRYLSLSEVQAARPFPVFHLVMCCTSLPNLRLSTHLHPGFTAVVIKILWPDAEFARSQVCIRCVVDSDRFLYLTFSGIRSQEHWADSAHSLIIGPFGSFPTTRLFRWTGLGSFLGVHCVLDEDVAVCICCCNRACESCQTFRLCETVRGHSEEGLCTSLCLIHKPTDRRLEKQAWEREREGKKESERERDGK